LTKALRYKHNINIEKNRLVLRIFSDKTLASILSSILSKYSGSNDNSNHRIVANNRLRIIELKIVFENEILLDHYKDISDRHRRSLELLKMGVFSQIKSVEDVLLKGNQYENYLYDFLHEKIGVNNNTNFTTY
jgi:hypothetical protein